MKTRIPKFKLQIRIVALIASMSLLLIFIFTTIQLRNHLDQMRSYNTYRARVGTIIVKTTLETLLKSVESEEALTGILRAAVSSFSREGVVERISILSTDGEAIASNDPLIRKFGETKRDIETYYRLSRAAGESAWFFSVINVKTQSIDIFIPLSAGEMGLYIAKLSFSIGNIREAIVDILVPIGLTAIAVVLANIILGVVLSRTVVRPIKILNMATKDIASGNLDRRVRISTNDEIEELGETFNAMTLALKKMKEIAEGASPLTGLPGNNMIMEEVENRIRKKLKFVAIHVDLDNFKSYNDRYGIAKGDEVITFTSGVLKKALREKGHVRDFLGHEGGDDFFVIVTPDEVQGVADTIITSFDSRIKDFYSKEDRQKGYILEKDRRGEPVKFPIMTISLSGVTNQYKTISSYAELTNIAVSVKQRAKEVKKSCFVLDRRKS